MLGTVGWAGLLATVVGLMVAIWQIRRAVTAAEAAANAARNVATELRSHERLLELATARGHLESAGQHIVLREFSLAGVFVDLATNECVQVRQMIEGAEQKRLYRTIVRLRKLSEALMQARQAANEDDQAVALAMEVKALIGALTENATRMRYRYDEDEKD
ncbi:MAG TPA: hypothetical protein VII40_18720 [Xanthobacteraceae bacterium]